MEMKKYNLKQELEITKENNETLKEVNLQVYLRENGMNEDEIARLFGDISNSFSRIIEDEIDNTNQTAAWEVGEPADAMGELYDEQKNIKKGWFK